MFDTREGDGQMYATLLVRLCDIVAPLELISMYTSTTKAYVMKAVIIKNIKRF